MTSAALQKTAERYRGNYAAEYDAKRDGQERRAAEADALRDMLHILPRGTTVLDAAFGTGWAIPLYMELGLRAHGVDINPDMLAQAALKQIDPRLISWEVGDILDIQAQGGSFDVSVAVRILNLLDEQSMQQAVRELQRVARSMVVFTLRIGESRERGQRHRKHSMAALEAALLPGWKIGEARLIHRNAWHMVRLARA
jgi:ubiquinone/menaquinone biosynthesis C-methylase UbiE